MKSVIIVAPDDSGLQPLFGIPVVRRLVLYNQNKNCSTESALYSFSLTARVCSRPILPSL